jgi:phosphoglucosamine mutase
VTLRFGTDGIRGVANLELTPELVTALGRAAAMVLGNGAPFIVGRDTRRSGPMIEAALIAGVCAQGVDVELVGVMPTPAVAFIADVRSAPAAVISASHNSYEDNGVKLFAPGGLKIPADLEARVEREVHTLANAAPPAGASGRGVGISGTAREAFDQYVAHVVDALDGRRLDGLRVVVDCGHGAAFRSAPRVLRELGAHVEVLNAAPDGTNINFESGSTDPTSLQKAVVELGATAGLALDGDADRVIAVDERGAIVDGDQILAVSALDLKERDALNGNAVVGTVMSNLGLRKCLAQHGIDFIETPVGDRYVSDQLEQRNLSLGGEQSGHIIFADHATTGDGTLTGAMLLDVVAGTGHPLSLLAGVMQRFPQVLRNVPLRDRDALEHDERLWSEVHELEEQLAPNGRVLVRPSGTEPVVRVMVEAMTIEQAELGADRMVEALHAAMGPPTGENERVNEPDRN